MPDRPQVQTYMPSQLLSACSSHAGLSALPIEPAEAGDDLTLTVHAPRQKSAVPCWSV